MDEDLLTERIGFATSAWMDSNRPWTVHEPKIGPGYLSASGSERISHPSG
jgi:hypothetical protein